MMLDHYPHLAHFASPASRPAATRKIAARVCRLFGGGRPATVFCAIRAIIIYSIDGMFGRGFGPHVRHEFTKGVPLRIKDYASAAILDPCGTVRVIAPALNVIPRRVKRVPIAARSQSMGGRPRACDFRFQAAATARIFAQKIGAQGYKSLAALTCAAPSRAPFEIVWRPLQNCQTRKDSPNQIIHLHMRRIAHG